MPWASLASTCTPDWPAASSSALLTTPASARQSHWLGRLSQPLHDVIRDRMFPTKGDAFCPAFARDPAYADVIADETAALPALPLFSSR